MTDPLSLMEAAINAARRGIADGQSPFGCAIAWEGRVVACEHNTVRSSIDITAHAEINALRSACRTTRQIFLPGAIVATTCEPCPMCLAALHWARVEVVYFGADIADAETVGFHELPISAAQMIRAGNSPLRLGERLLLDECRALFRQWRAGPAGIPY